MKTVSHAIVVSGLVATEASAFEQKADVADPDRGINGRLFHFDCGGSDLVRRKSSRLPLDLRVSLCLCIGLFFLTVLANAATNYVLTNGVITLPGRPPEALTGTFALADEIILNSPHGEVRYYELLALEFQSASVSFALSTGSLGYVPNSEGPPTAYFTAGVKATGLPLETVLLRSSGVGDAFQNISISDTNETQQLGTMSFSAVAVLAPRLSISRVDSTAIQIAWAGNFMGYRLEVATSFPATMWEAVTNSGFIESDRIKVSLPTDGTQRWYRLREP